MDIKVKKELAVLLAVVGVVMSGTGVMITAAAKEAASRGLPTCGAPVETSISLYFVEKYGDEFWRTIIIMGCLFIGLSIILFVFPIRKKK